MEVISFKPEFGDQFRDLNLEWLKEFFYVEEHDYDVLNNPVQNIIDPGGCIFFVKKEEELVATVALMPLSPGVYELTKMAVSPALRGLKIGQFLMEHSLRFAQKQGWTKLIIYSNRKLENAIYIYKKFGFKEIPLEENLPYDRADIKLELFLKSSQGTSSQ